MSAVRSEIVEGLAEMMWAYGWIGHVDEHGCERVSGMNVVDIMPPVPKEATALAEKWAQEIEKKNGKSLATLYADAMAANEREGVRSSKDSTERAFGNFLYDDITGSGSGWDDYNAKFPIKLPSHESPYDLQDLAGSRCKKSWDNPPCTECGTFGHEGRKKCSNCGTAIADDEDD